VSAEVGLQTQQKKSFKENIDKRKYVIYKWQRGEYRHYEEGVGKRQGSD
jgi:hypothetical protein